MTNNSMLLDRTFKGLFWMFSGKGSQAILQFTVMIVLARLLTPSEFGIVNAATVVITFTTVFSMVGVGPALVQRSELTEADIRTGFTLTLFLSFFFAITLYFTSSLIAGFFYMEKLKPVLKIMSMIFILKGLSIVSESLLQRKLKFKIFASIEVVSYLAYGIIGVILAISGASYWALVYAQLAQEFTKTILLICVEKHNMKPQLKWESVKSLLFFGGGFTIARLSNQFALQADNLVVGRWLGENALGLYGRAYQLMIMPANLFGQVMDKVMFSAMARIQKKQDQLTRAYKIGITSVAFITIPVGIFISLTAEEIVRVLFGEDWISLVPAFQVLAVGLLFRTSYKISDSLARATGAVYRRAWRQIVYAIAVFVGAWIGHHWGIVGVSYGVLCAIIINYCLMLNLSMKFVNLTVKDILKSHVPGLLLGLVSIVSVLLTDWILFLFIPSPIFSLVLSVCLFLIITIFLVNVSPNLFLGKDVIWIKDQIFELIKKRKSK